MLLVEAPGALTTPHSWLPTRLALGPGAPGAGGSDDGWRDDVDAIVVGTGVAGLTAALRLHRRGLRVAVVTKTVLASGSTRWAQGGIAAALSPTDSAEAHLRDTMAAGGGLCDPEAVRVLVTDGPRRVRGLVDLGARFDLDPAGDLALTREGGHGADRIAHAGGDATGEEISRALVQALEALPSTAGVVVYEHAMAVDVVLDGDGAVCGLAVMIEPNGAATGQATSGAPARAGAGVIRARAVVLATGGIGQVFRSTTNPPEATGDGAALALRAGAALADLEFVQFHPTVLWLGGAARGQQPLISEALRGEGATLVDERGVRFMLSVDSRAELAPRDVVARGIVDRMRDSGADHVFLDARHLGRSFLRQRFPTIMARLGEFGIDMGTDLVPVSPAAHYHSGGVRTDLVGRTTVDGLYAVGECACTGVHGANRLASNSLLEGLVFAARLGDDIAARIAAGELNPGPTVVSGAQVGVTAASAVSAIQRSASLGPGVVRAAASLAAAAQALDTIERDARVSGVVAVPGRAEWEASNLLQVAVALTAVAARRSESRGGHVRSDHPGVDDRWRLRQLVRLHADGTLHVTDEEVPRV